jgi:hypothetical protein
MPTKFGPKLCEITALHAVSAACKVKVKDAGDLLLLRDWLFEELGPPYMWTVMLSVFEWEHLTDDQKERHRTMRDSWLPVTAKPRTSCSSTGFGGSSRNRQNLSHPFTRCLRKSRLTRLTVVPLRGRKFSFCTPSPVHLSRTSSSLVASRRVSVSRMTQWLLLSTTWPLSTPLLLNSATCSP